MRCQSPLRKHTITELSRRHPSLLLPARKENDVSTIGNIGALPQRICWRPKPEERERRFRRDGSALTSVSHDLTVTPAIQSLRRQREPRSGGSRLLSPEGTRQSSTAASIRGSASLNIQLRSFR